MEAKGAIFQSLTLDLNPGPSALGASALPSIPPRWLLNFENLFLIDCG